VRGKPRARPCMFGRATVSALNVAPKELNLPGFAFHELKKPRKGTYAVTIQGNWRITFKWDEQGPFDVDMEDYHGR